MNSPSSDSLNSELLALEDHLEDRLHPTVNQSKCLQFIFCLLRWLFFFCIPKKNQEKEE